jgi:uncharacterized membrane protein YesL
VIIMDETHEGRAGAARNNSSLWDDLRAEPLLDPTEPITIQRGFFRTLFSSFYDHLGTLLLLNVLVLLQGLAGLAVGLFLGVPFAGAPGLRLVLLVLCGGLAVAPAVGGLFSYTRAICDPDMLSSLQQYWRGMRTYAVRSWILLAVEAASGGLLFLNIRFYATLHGAPGLAIMLVVLLLTLVWAMANVYAWPLLVRDVGWGMLARNAVFLALAAPFSTIAIMLVLSALSAVLVVTRIGAVLALFTIWAVTENVALVRLVRLFAARQEGTAVEGEDTTSPG